MPAYDVYGERGKVDTVEAPDRVTAVSRALSGPVDIPREERGFRVVEAGVPVYFADTVYCGRDSEGRAVNPWVKAGRARDAAADGGGKR